MNDLYFWVGAIFTWTASILCVSAFVLWSLDKIVKHLGFYSDFFEFINWLAQKRRDEAKEQSND